MSFDVSPASSREGLTASKVSSETLTSPLIPNFEFPTPITATFLKLTTLLIYAWNNVDIKKKGKADVYLPLKSAFRFDMKASTPSLRSSVENDKPIRLASNRKPASKGTCVPKFKACLAYFIAPG